jgi:hypothetical protein
MADKPVNLAARRRWKSIPKDLQRQILENVWCNSCREAVLIVDWQFSNDDDMGIIKGKCLVCGGECARVIDDD